VFSIVVVLDKLMLVEECIDTCWHMAYLEHNPSPCCTSGHYRALILGHVVSPIDDLRLAFSDRTKAHSMAVLLEDPQRGLGKRYN
jgi:hypothetical protein